MTFNNSPCSRKLRFLLPLSSAEPRCPKPAVLEHPEKRSFSICADAVFVFVMIGFVLFLAVEKL